MYTPSRNISGASSQRGQVLPIGIALILFGSLLAIVLFNSGQMTSEKSRLTNTADAAVYSGLIWQARALNFQAYTNRAMVANQVSIAQFVSLNGWSKYGRDTAFKVNNSLGFFPPFRPFTQAADSTMVVVDTIVNVVASVAVPVIDGVNMVLSETQRAVYVSTFAITPILVEEVVEANNTNYDVNSVYAIASLGKNALDWNNFAKRYDDEAGLKRKADVINRSRDDFTKKRNWKLGTFWLAPTLKFKLRKEGATHLVYDGEQWAWKAKDTLSLHWRRYRCSWKGCKWKRREIPISWGAAYASEDIGCGGSCPRWVSYNRKSQSLANKDDPEQIAGYNGVRAYYDLTDLSANNKDPRLQLRVEVQVGEGDVRTSTKVEGLGSASAPTSATVNNGIGEGVFWTADKTASNTMASLSSGEVYFERPSALRVSGTVKKEYGNLFNPYWQVRLIETTNEYRLAAWVLRSPELVSSSASGVATALTRYAGDQLEELQVLQDLESYAQQEIDQLAEYVEHQTQIVQQIDGIQSQVASVEQTIQQAIDSGMSETSEFLEQRNIELQQLQALETAAEAQLQTVIAQVDNAQQLQEQIETVQNQITEVTNQINLPELELAQGFIEDVNQTTEMVEELSTLGLSDIQNGLIEAGTEALQGALEDALIEQVETILEDAVTAVINQYGGDIVQFVESVDETIEAVEGLNEEYIQPLRDQVELMETQIADLRAQVEAEIQAGVAEFDNIISNATSEMNQRVSQLENQLQQEVDSAENALTNVNSQIEDKLAEQLELIIPSEIEALQNQIDSLQLQASDLVLNVNQLQNRLTVETAELQNQFQGQIDALAAEKQALADSVTSEIESVTATLNADVASVKEQIAELVEEQVAGALL
jgi:hypothetical protein